MNQPKSYLKWLLLILAIVILAALGVYFFYVKGVKNVGGLFSLSSPTPTKSTAVSPPGTTKTSTPASRTTTSGNQISPAVSPASSPQTPPAGWQETTTQVFCAGSCYAEFSVFIKSGWTKHSNDTGHTPVFFTTNDQCLPDSTLDTSNCYGDLIVSLSQPSEPNLTSRSYNLSNGKIWVSLNNSVSPADQNIVFNSFRVISDVGI